MEDAFEYVHQAEPEVALKAGLDLTKLREDGGAEFELAEPQNADETTEVDDEEYWRRGSKEAYRYYEPDVMGNGEHGQDSADTDDSEGEDSTPFQVLARRMESVTPDGGVRKGVLKQGVGPAVPDGAFATVHYNAYLEYADEPFDSSRLRGRPVKYMIGSGEMFAGMEIALKTMRRGEESRFLVEAKYFLGEQGCGARVPKGAPTLWTIELIKWVDAAGVDEYYAMPMSDRRTCDFNLVKKIAHKHREDGKEKFKLDRFKEAARQYEQGIKVLEEHHLQNEEEEKEQQKVLLTFYLNAAICHNKLGQCSLAIRYANEALNIDPNDTKAMFAKGRGLHGAGHFNQAKGWFLRILKHDEGNKAVKEQLMKLESNMKKFNTQESEMCKKMFAFKGNKEEKRVETGLPDKAAFTEVDCSDEFKAIVRDRLQTFLDDPELMEMPFPNSNLSIGELACVGDQAHNLGLNFVTRGEGNNRHMRILKDKIKGSFSS